VHIILARPQRVSRSSASPGTAVQMLGVDGEGWAHTRGREVPGVRTRSGEGLGTSTRRAGSRESKPVHVARDVVWRWRLGILAIKGSQGSGRGTLTYEGMRVPGPQSGHLQAQEDGQRPASVGECPGTCCPLIIGGKQVGQ